MELMSKKEAAELLTISVRSLERMLNSGELPYYRIGTGTVRISRRDIETYLNSRRVQVVAVKKSRTAERPCGYIPGMKVV